MRTFTMSGMPIRSPLAFRNRFSPEDILRDPKLAAAFAMNILAPLSEWDRFNSDALFTFAFFQDNAFVCPPEMPTDYFLSRTANSFRRRSSCREMLELREEEPETRALLKSLWDMTRRIEVPDGVRDRTFGILAASFFLARADWETHPVSPEAVLSAIGGAKREENDVIALPPGDGPVCIPANRRPYRMAVYPDTPAGRGLAVRKVIAGSHPLGGNVPLTVLLCRNGLEDRRPDTLEISQGDYRYLLLADGVPVRFMPTAVENGEWSLIRVGDRMELRRGGILVKRVPAGDVISMCLDVLGAGKAGWAVVTSDRTVDHSNHPHGYSAFSNWEPENVLEAAVDRGEWWVLTGEGQACSRYGKLLRGVTDLRNVIQKQER